MTWKSRSTSTTLALAMVVCCHSMTQAFRVAVFGGTGFIGRRVCETLVKAGCEVYSISWLGAPPTCYCDPSWSDQVEWISYDLASPKESLASIGPLDGAISCVGNLNPSSEWKELFGLGFDDDQLMIENGEWNEKICEIAKNAGAERFVLMSVNYETSKALEGAIPGYIYGKRRAESKACQLFGAENTIALGLPLVYGGMRFPTLGFLYRSFVESPIAKAYLGSNDFLRNLSVTPLEDWVEKMVFSSPVHVESVARVASAAVLGKIRRDMVGPRKQGFYDTNGKAVEYDDVIFVDGAAKVEALDSLVDFVDRDNIPSPIIPGSGKGPFWEAALVRKLPWLYPMPVIAFFGTIFWSVVTQQFVQTATDW